jgi:pilus assembly protein CpaB
VALVLAVLAVVGVRAWMMAQREAIAVEAQADQEGPKNFVAVARVPMGFGERVTPETVELIEWASDRVPEGAFSNLESLVGTTEEDARYALSSIAAGEMIMPGKITMPGQRAKLSTAISPGMRAISIRVNDVLGVAGFVLPGDRVDIMLTRNGADGAPFVDILLQGVRVVAIDQIADDRKDQPSVVRTVTFEVSTQEAQKLTLAATVGTLSLALRNVAAPAVEETDRISIIDLNDVDGARQESELAAAQAALAAAQSAQDQTSAEALARVAALEAELQALRDAQAAQGEAAPVVDEAVKDEFANVGVIRGGQRAEYRVLLLGQ